MKWLVLLLASLQAAYGLRTVCYWNGKSFWREGTAKVTSEELKAALPHCTHLLYGFAAIDDDDYHIEPIDKKLDLDKGKGQWRAVTALKRSYPGLSILLSLGGNEDTEDVGKYFEVLEKQERRTKLINSIVSVLKDFQFDGIDLAWEFPPQHEKHTTTSISSIWHKIKKTVGVGVDSQASEHRDQFTALVRELKAVLRPDGKQLSIAVLPHVNSSVYFDIRQLTPYVDMVNLWTADYRTPERTPDKADYATPLTYVYPRIPFQNVESTVSYWLQHGGEASKIQLGIPTWGRTWKLTSDSGLSGVPPLIADGAGDAGPHTKKEGLLAYYETCVKLVSPTNPQAPAGMLRRMQDAPGSHLGTYGFRLADKNTDGLWVSFEEPQTAAGKAIFAKQRGLGGVAILDLALDDSRGICDGSAYPITKAAKSNLDLGNQGSPIGDRYQTVVTPIKNWVGNITKPTWVV
ncbi:imaginal disc growth factor [Nesidiocoris tenuis]|uniref:Imaginal disc growth factor n=1 Tax=Nesidiocoris tenuis TaxID=355587 RepID=A0ABN7BDJ0_9HEMI|nr:imaginal disc growth factor [Nesidiocoris tenuis]